MDEREFELVNIVGANLGANQRKISLLINLSLGQTNMLLRRLVSKGYIRISQLNQKKVSYLLTPKGIQEKINQSIKYTLKTINAISLIKDQTKITIGKYYAEGERHFHILGKSDFAYIVEMVVKDPSFAGCRVDFVEPTTVNLQGGVLLLCEEKVKVPPGWKVKIVDLLFELSKDGLLTLSEPVEYVTAIKNDVQ